MQVAAKFAFWWYFGIFAPIFFSSVVAVMLVPSVHRFNYIYCQGEQSILSTCSLLAALNKVGS